MNIEKNKSLKKYNTFNIDAFSKYFISINNIIELKDLLLTDILNTEKYYILGGGSNTLFTKDFTGIIIYNNIKGVEVLKKTKEYIDIEIMSGESWPNFVMWSVENNYWGIEKLALIPGTIGASAVQNIGAYGSEAKDSIIHIKTIDIKTGKEKIFIKDNCKFEYRSSIFKKKPNIFIISIVFRLNKIKKSKKTSKDIAIEIINTRKSKLPEVGEIGMAGSFFKNPIVDRKQLTNLVQKYPTIKYFEVSKNKFKVPAGWLIESLGYKGIRKGSVGTYHNHSLVLVNYKNATGKEVFDFSKEIIQNVKHNFNIVLEPEVIIL